VEGTLLVRTPIIYYGKCLHCKHSRKCKLNSISWPFPIHFNYMYHNICPPMIICFNVSTPLPSHLSDMLFELSILFDRFSVLFGKYKEFDAYKTEGERLLSNFEQLQKGVRSEDLVKRLVICLVFPILHLTF
jgi:hypothetical protein